MINLTIYGKPSSTYEYAKLAVFNKAKEAKVNLSVSEVSDTKQFITDSIESIPAFRIENEVKSIGSKNLNNFIEEVNQWILEKENYGTMKKIIVPTDFSESAHNALEYAYQLAQQINGVIQLVHIFHPTPVGSSELTYIEPELEKIKRKRLDQYAHKVKLELKDKYDTSALFDTSFELGFPGDKLIELSETTENALIVMGSTGETGAMKRILGSVSTRVAKESNCPVLIIPPDVTYSPLKNISYCSDSIALDAIATHKIIDFIKPFNPLVHLIHVGKEEHKETDVLLHLWKNYYPKSKVSYKQIWGEKAIESINLYSAANDIDMVVISTEKRGFLRDLFHRSFTKRMAINTKLPLFITHTNMVLFST